MYMMFDLIQFTDNIAIIEDEGSSLTYEALNKKVENLSSVLVKGKLSFNLCRNTTGSIIGYLAMLKSSVPAVMLDGDKGTDVIQLLINIYQPQYLWLPTTRVSEFEGATTVIDVEDYTLLQFNWPNYEIHPDVALMLTTSGSTGSPKLVKLTAKNLVSNAESIAEYLEITASERPITSLPMNYSYGLSVINSHLLKGSTILLTYKAVIQKEFWVFAKERAATSIAGVPYTYEMLKRLRIFTMDLPSLKTFTQAGGKLNPALVKEFIEQAQATDRKFIVMYGQTEATARMSYTPCEKALAKYASIGIAIPGGALSILDTEGNEITTTDTDGELVFKGPNVSMGYAECIADLAKGDENHGELHTGDMARFDADGFYYITGRLNRVVKVWGNRCSLDETEQLVKARVITDCACVGVDDLITIFVTKEGLDQDIKLLLTSKLGLNIRAFAVKVIDDIPKNTSGKTLYAELQKLI
jgi:acyl-CoA synthetase (AMP-forming)/AMP-acid ligase II